MYKNKEKQKEYNRERMAKLRQGNTAGNTAGNTNQGNTTFKGYKNVLPETVVLYDGQIWHRQLLPSLRANGQAYRPVIQAKKQNIAEHLIDPVYRNKLERICKELKNHNQLDNVFMGNFTMAEVGQMLDATQPVT